MGRSGGGGGDGEGRAERGGGQDRDGEGLASPRPSGIISAGAGKNGHFAEIRTKA